MKLKKMDRTDMGPIVPSVGVFGNSLTSRHQRFASWVFPCSHRCARRQRQELRLALIDASYTMAELYTKLQVSPKKKRSTSDDEDEERSWSPKKLRIAYVPCAIHLSLPTDTLFTAHRPHLKLYPGGRPKRKLHLCLTICRG